MGIDAMSQGMPTMEGRSFVTEIFDALRKGESKEKVSALVDDLKSRLEALNQDALAENFFSETIGGGRLNTADAYPVYVLLKGTRFAEKFAELEDTRLKAVGYEQGFIL